MTQPIRFNPFQGVGGAEQLPPINDRRHNLRNPDIDMSSVDIQMDQGQDIDGEAMLESFDMDFSKKLPKNN